MPKVIKSDECKNNAIEFINSVMEAPITEDIAEKAVDYAICVGMARMAYYLGEISDDELDEIMTKAKNICIDSICDEKKGDEEE